LSLTNDLSDSFFEDLIDLCGRLQCDALDLLGVMMAESNVTAAARNATSNASGLIQFLPSTLAHLGWTGTPDAFRKLSADQQLRYVEAYFQPYVHFGLNSAARVYQVVFLPSSLSLGSSFSTVIAKKGGLNSAIYDRNRGLDTDFNGTITVGELQKAIERHYNAARWQEIAERLDETGGSGQGGSAGDDGAIDLRTQDGVFDALEALGFDRGHYTYAAAVRAFQKRSGLSADGIAGPRTRQALTSALDESDIAYTI
jgi:Putative peptidoglycan binding domain